MSFRAISEGVRASSKGEQFEAATRHVPASEVAANVRVSADLGWLQGYVALGFEELYLHHVGQHNQAFIAAFGAEVLPTLQLAPSRSR